MTAGPSLLSPRAVADTFRDLFRHGTTSIGVAALLCVPYLLAQIFWLTNPSVFGRLASAVSIFLVAVWLPWLLTIATREFAQGKDPGVGEVLSETKFARIFSFLFAQISAGIVCLGAALLGALPLAGVAIAVIASGNIDVFEVDSFGPLLIVAFAAGLIGLAIGFAALLVVYLRIGLAPQASALDKAGPVASLSRSSRVSRGHRLDFLLLLIMLMGMMLVISIVVQGPAALAQIGSGGEAGVHVGGSGFSEFSPFGGRALPVPQALIVAFSGYVVNVLTSVLSAGVLANFYLALRGEEMVRDAVAPEASS